MWTKKLMDRNQNTSSTRPERAGRDLFSGPTYSTFFFQQLFVCLFVVCLQTATVCLVLVSYFASWWVIPRCQGHFGVPVLKHGWGRSVLRLWLTRTHCSDVAMLFQPVHNLASHSHACQSDCGCLTAVFCFKVFAPWIKEVRVTCFTLHVRAFQSCFCFVLNVSGSCLIISHGSGWVFLYSKAQGGNICISCLFMLPWAWRADGHSLLQFCLVTEELSVHAICQGLVSFILFEDCCFLPQMTLSSPSQFPWI